MDEEIASRARLRLKTWNPLKRKAMHLGHSENAKQKRWFHLFRAFAHHQLDPESPEMAEELEAARPDYAGEYDYLGPYWPEMGAFVTAFVGYPQPAGGTLPRAKVVSIDVDN